MIHPFGFMSTDSKLHNIPRDQPFSRSVTNCRHIDLTPSNAAKYLVDMDGTLDSAVNWIKTLAKMKVRSSFSPSITYFRMTNGGKTTFLRCLYDRLKGSPSLLCTDSHLIASSTLCTSSGRVSGEWSVPSDWIPNDGSSRWNRSTRTTSWLIQTLPFDNNISETPVKVDALSF
jgi:hypothetical protein